MLDHTYNLRYRRVVAEFNFENKNYLALRFTHSVTLDEKSSSKSNLYIMAGTLEGSRSYTVTLIVSLKDDPRISVSVDVLLDVISTPLVAKIKGKEVIGINRFTLALELKSPRNCPPKLKNK